ncbi:SDR family oxidoreductase [Paracidobacterium acidisoli]|uniref:SDR family NAD(P)-dependent oxidoreductase n=1 Tax=Paracidobacterium acidisoli TaxID=2303751 RepID=A0A372ISU9_9BACT|nr:SDR family oxidoreductase [Paracidobacterium acidisoli]MBT9330853.1 SDR family oxidoreductase [Paracidobacterium acidisoli]
MRPILNVVITGASAGLGRAIAHEFGKTGARVGLISRDLPALDATAAEVERLGGTAATYAADVSDDQAVEAAAASFEERLGPIDIWVNNAMVSVFSPIKEMEAAEFRRVTEVNYLGYVHGTLAALRRMLPRNRGRIIQIGSALAVRSIPLQSAYCATKHAIVGFTDSLRCELYHDSSDVKAIVVHMPAMNTPQFTWVKSRLPNLPQPVPPIYKPEVGARVVVHAAFASMPRREYWVGGSTVKAIVGQKFIPGLLDFYLGKTGYKAQQSPEPDSPDRPNNVWHSVSTDLGADGPFDRKSRSFSLEAEVSKHRGWFVFGCGLIGAAFCARKILAR